MSAGFPDWLEPAWQQLAGSWQQGRLPHALLFTGASGVGKRLLAERLAALLLCEQPLPHTACGQCQACNWLQAGSHPDLALLQPEEVGKAIKVDQVRALGIELGMTSHGGRYKVAVIAPADAMNVNAANSLLKTLEEPTAGTLLVLLSAAPGRLLATVRSRCQQIRIPVPADAAALTWLKARGIGEDIARRCLQVARGAPLAAAELAGSDRLALRDRWLSELAGVFSGEQDPLRVAADWHLEHSAWALQWWQEWLQVMINWQQACQPPQEAQVARTLQQISESVDCRHLYELYDRVTGALNSLGSGLNRQLLLEDLLIDWARLAGSGPERATVTGS